MLSAIILTLITLNLSDSTQTTKNDIIANDKQNELSNSNIIVNNPQTLPKENRKHIQDSFQNYIVKLIGSGENETQGTAFFFDNNNLILTNFHIVQSCDYFEIEDNTSKKYPAYLVEYDNQNDLAVLFVPDCENYDYLSFEKKLPKQNEVVHAAGFPNGEYNLSSGLVKEPEYNILNTKYISSSTTLEQGNSGGPLINESNKIIGINCGKYEDSHYLAIPAVTAIEFINSIDKTNLEQYIK